MNRIVVITGASSGLGLKLKEKYQNQKDTVICLALDSETDNKLNFKCDVSNLQSLQSIFDCIKKEYGKIDILINCAGYGLASITELVSEEAQKKMFDVNFFGTLNTCKLALPMMPKGGKIINISSACAIFPLPYRTLYCASKSAVSMLTECLDMEVRHLDIKVTNICPGDIKTNFSKNRVKEYTSNERYGNLLEQAMTSIDQREDKRMSLEYASQKVFNICEKNHFKPMYIIGRSYKMLYALNKLFPKKLINNFIYKKFGGKFDN